MRTISPLTSLAVCVVALLALQTATPPSHASETPATQTFTVLNLDLKEAVSMLRGMTGVEEITADPKAGTIVAVATPATLRMVDTLLKVFDTEQPQDQDSAPLEIRVFDLDRLSAREAITQLRMKLTAKQIAMNADGHRVAMRDTRERLEEAAKLLSVADVAGD